jgi:UPF0271 protein
VSEVGAVVERARLLAEKNEMVAIDGTRLPLRVESMCVHGDTPGAMELVRAIREAFVDADVTMAPFVSVPVTVGANP